MIAEAVPEVRVGGVSVHVFKSMEQAVSNVFSGENPRGFAVAVNPEKVIATMTDEAARRALSAATIRYADGIGVVLAMRRSFPDAVRIAGCDLWEQLMIAAGRLGVPVYLIGAKAPVVERVVERLRRQYGVNVVGARDGFFSSDEVASIAESVKRSGAKFVSVAMGSPRQEKVIADLMSAYPSCFYMGVGGTFDVFAGAVRRAPVAFQKLHLEWLYRVVTNPRRVKRYKSLVKYAWLLLTRRL